MFFELLSNIDLVSNYWYLCLVMNGTYYLYGRPQCVMTTQFRSVFEVHLSHDNRDIYCKSRILNVVYHNRDNVKRKETCINVDICVYSMYCLLACFISARILVNKLHSCAYCNLLRRSCRELEVQQVHLHY